MQKFCSSCGTPYEEGTRFCGNCGASLTEENVTPAPAAPETPAPAPAPAKPAITPANIGEMVKTYSKYILIGFAVIGLLLAILNFTGSYDVSITAKLGGIKNSESGSISDLYEVDDFAILKIGNYIHAILMLGAGAIAALGVMKAYNISNAIDNVVKGDKVCKEVCASGLLGVVAVVLQLVCFILTGLLVDTGFGAKISISLPWFSWLALLLFGAAVVCDKVILNKKK